MARYNNDPNNKTLVINEEQIDTESLDANLNVSIEEYDYRECTINHLVVESGSIKSLALYHTKVGVLTIDYSSIGKIVIMQSSVDVIDIRSKLAINLVSNDVNRPSTIEKSIGWMLIARSKIGKLKTESVFIERLFLKSNAEMKSIILAESLLNNFTIEQQSDSTQLQIDEMLLRGTKIAAETQIVNCFISKIELKGSYLGDTLLYKVLATEVDVHLYRSSSLLLSDCTITDLKFQSGNYDHITLLGGSFGDASFVSSFIKNLTVSLDNTADKSNKLRFEKIDLSRFQSNTGSIVKIYDVEVRTLDLSNFDNLGNFELADSNIAMFNMKHTRLGGALVTGIHFDSIVLYDAVIGGARFANIDWPADHLLSENAVLNVDVKSTKKKEIHIRLSDAYRQLMTVCLNAHDRTNALGFHKHEMNHVWQLAKMNWKQNPDDFLILGSNKLLSDFGQSLCRPLIWGLGIHTILFWLLLQNFVLPVVITTERSEMSLDAFWEGMGMYLNLIFPIHDKTLRGVDIFGVVDFLMRLSSAFFIYYFIRATRKYNFGP